MNSNTIRGYNFMKSVWRQLSAGTVVGGLFFLLFWSYTTNAHALLVRSIPEAGAELTIAPTAVTMWFSEPLEANFSTAYLVDGEGNEFGRGMAVVDADDPFQMSLPLANLSPGYYTVVWETLSQADGHSWIGSFPLTLLNPDGSRPVGTGAVTETLIGSQPGEIPTLLAVISRWLGLLGSMLIFGVFFFRAQINRTDRIDLTIADPKKGRSAQDILKLFRAAVEPTISTGLLVGMVGVIVGGWLHWFTQSGLNDPAVLFNLILHTRSGNLGLARQMLVGVAILGTVVAFYPASHSGVVRLLFGFVLFYTISMWGGVGWAMIQQADPFLVLCSAIGLLGIFGFSFIRFSREGTIDRPDVRHGVNWLFFFISALILASFSLGSHAAAVGGSGWAILNDLVHLVAAAIWIGGLILLAAILWQLRTDRSTDMAIPLRSLVARFSAIATLAVFGLFVTGFYSTLVQLSSLEQLWRTTYGWVLLAKLALVTVTLGLALLNHRFVSSTTQKQWTISDSLPFRRRVWIEALTSLGLMVVVAVLVQTPIPLSSTPSPDASDTVFQEVLAADDLSIHLLITPNQPGNNQYQTHLYHADGSAIGEVQLVRLFFSHQEVELGQASLDLVAQGNDLFLAEGAYQNRSGAWDIEIYVRRRGLDDALIGTTVITTQSTVVVARRPWQNPIPALPPATQIMGLLLSIGVGVVIWRSVKHKSLA